MKKSTKLFSGLSALAIVAMTVTTAGSVFAYQGDPSTQGPNYSEEVHEEMTQAFQNNDYTAWSNLMADKGRNKEIINADNFARFSEAHQLAEDGDLEGAKAIRTELGLGLKNGSGQHQGQGKGQGQGTYLL